MSFSQQIIHLLSQPPGSVVYHLVTLLAVQAALGLALWQRRRAPDDSFARRLVAACLGILLARLSVLLALLVGSAASAPVVLPVLERAIDAVTAVMLIWLFLPRLRSFPRLLDIGAALLLIVIGLLAAFYAQDWARQVAASPLAGGYPASNQAAAWDSAQLGLLAAGAAVILWVQSPGWGLRSALLLLLAGGHLAALIARAQPAPAGTDVSYWVRLAELIAFPLLAVIAQRHNLSQLLPAGGQRAMPAGAQAGQALSLAEGLLASQSVGDRLEAALLMARSLLSAPMAALALDVGPTAGQLQVVHLLRAGPGAAGQPQVEQRRALRLNELPAVRQALDGAEPVQLNANGSGARQLHYIYTELDLQGYGDLLVCPLSSSQEAESVLLLARPSGAEAWQPQERALAGQLATFAGAALRRSAPAALAPTAPTAHPAAPRSVAARPAVEDDRGQALMREWDLAQADLAQPRP
ncbi:MAG: hypothetical protein ACRDHL_09130, partial [Candidatus Promineifilaceae bacterium]